MQDPFAPVDPFGKPYEVSGPASALLGIGAGKQAGKSSKAKPKAKAKAKVLEDPLLNPKKQKQGPPIPAGYKAPVSLDEALLLPKGSLLPPGQENKPRKENRQRLSKTWKALEGRGLSAQDLELAQSIVFMSMKDRDGNELSPVEGERNLAEFKPTLTEKEALDILRDPLKRAEAEGQRKAWREMRKISTAQKEGKPWQPTSTEPGFVPGKEQDAEGQSMTRSHRLQKAFEKGIAPGLLAPGVWQDIRDELSHRSGKWYAENGPLALGIKLTGGDPSKNEANVWVGGLVGNLIGGTLDPMAALEFAADDKKPGFDRLAAAAQAAIGMVGAGQAVNSVNDVMRLVPNLGKKAGLPPEALKETVQGILDDIRTNSPKLDDPDVAVPPMVGKQEPPPLAREPQAAQEAELRARLEEPPVKGIPDEPETLPSPYKSKSVEPPSGVKEPGNSVTLYHGTNKSFTEFDPSLSRRGGAIFATPDKEFAGAYGNVEEVQANIRKLHDVNDPTEFENFILSKHNDPKVQEEMRRLAGELEDDWEDYHYEAYGITPADELDTITPDDIFSRIEANDSSYSNWYTAEFPGFFEYLKGKGYDAVKMREHGSDTYALLGGKDQVRKVNSKPLQPGKPVDTPAQTSTTVEPPLTTEAPQNAVETPKITLDDARQIEDPKARREALKQAWASRAQEAAQGKEGSLASGVDPDFLRYVYDVGKTYVEEGLADFAAWSKAMLADLGDEIKPHLEKAWATVKPNKDFGLAAAYEPEGRAASGFLNVEDLAKRGEELVTSGQIVPDSVYKKAVYDGHVTPDEIAAIAYRGKAIENRTAVIEQELSSGTLDDAELGARMAELSVLQSEMGSVLEVGDVAQKTFHQTGQALQVAFSPNYTPVRVRAMAKAYNYGEELDPKIANRLDTLTNSLTEAKGRISKLEGDLEKALRERATRAGGTRSADPATKKAALLRAINSDLGLDKYTVTAPGIRGKTTGAVSVPKNKQKAMAGYVNSLTKLYIEEGASTLDDVVKRFQGDMPLLSRDDVLGLLNKEYREATLEADVHKLEIDRALRMVQEQAKRARTSVGKRLVNEAGDGVISLQRQMQAGLDASLSFIQGFGGGQVSPSSWGKAWVPWFRVMKEGQTGVAKVNAQLHADPGFKFARKMGVGFSDASGSLGMQEEVLLGHLTQKARESKVPVVRQYFEFLARSQEAGTAFLNKLRLELFKKFVAGNWKDEQSMRDAAMLTNILTGRGSGAMADALSAKPFGYIAYAPRYTWSKYQNAALPLLLPTKITSKAGRTAAASAWTKQTAFALAVPYIAQSLGIEVDLDMHSSQFGAITLPNGGTLRLFKHFTEPVQTLFQISQGRTSKSGNFTPPGYMSSQIVGQYLTGKGSPMFSTGYRQLTNNRYDPALGEGVEFNLAKNPDDWKVSAYELFTPLSVQNAIESAKEGDVLGAFLSMMGIEYSPSKGTETTASGRR